jgi:hypothetical protein
MPPKITLTTAMTLILVIIMGQLQAIVNQFTNNSIALNNKINSIGVSKVKMPLIKRFSGEKVKLKGFLI